MFKRLAIFALLLSACSSQTSTPPRFVTFNDVFVGYAPIENDCDWQEVDISVFNQKDQRVSFLYSDCSVSHTIEGWDYLSLRSGDRILAKTDRQSVIVKPSGKRVSTKFGSNISYFSIAKLGPLTERDYLSEYHKNHPLRNDMTCSIKQIDDFMWGYESTGHCEGLKGVRFIFKGGLVLRMRDIDASKDVIKLSSITYTNRG